MASQGFIIGPLLPLLYINDPFQAIVSDSFSAILIRNSETLDTVYNGTGIKQYEKVKYLGCILDESVSGESMVFSVIDKINGF